MQPSTKQRYLPLFLLLGLSLVWGSSFILMKKGLSGFPADQVAGLRMFFAFIAVSPFVFQTLKRVPANKWKYIAIASLCGNFIPAFLFTNALTKIDSSIAGILNALTPIFTFIFSVLLFKNRINHWQIVGLLIGFSGSGWLSFVRADGSFGSLNSYALLIIISSTLYALSTNTIRSQLIGVKSVDVMAGAFLIAGVLGGAYLLTTDVGERIITNQASREALVYLAILGMIGTAFAVFIFNYVIWMTSAVYASSVTYIVPLVAIGWGIYDGEQVTWLHLLGMSLIICGVYIVNRNQLKN